MGYWLSEPSILDPTRFDTAMTELADASYAFVRIMLRNTNFTHRSPKVVVAVAHAVDAGHARGLRIALDCEPHARPLAGDLGRQFPDAMSTRLVRGSGKIINGKFKIVVFAPHVDAHMAAWEGIEAAFVMTDGGIVPIDGLAVNLDWEIETYREGDTRLRQDYVEGKAVSERRKCRLTGSVPGHADGELILYARFADTALIDFWAPGTREYFDDLIERYRGIPLDGMGWDEPAIGGSWESYRYGKWFAQAFSERNGYALADRLYLLDSAEMTPEAVKVRLDYYATLNEGVAQAQEALVAKSREVFGANLLLGTHHTWQGEGGINDYRAGAVDYFRLADSQDAGYTDCWWWDEKSVCYAYVLGSSIGRLTASGETELNTWHAKPTNSQVEFNARLMSLFDLTWFNIWYGDNGDTCLYPHHYTWDATKVAMRAHDAVQEKLYGFRPVVDVAVWHGWEGVCGLNDPHMANAHKTCEMNLATLSIDRSAPFDFIDSRLIESAQIVSDTHVTGLGRYRALVMPYAVVILESVWQMCKKLASAGGHIVFVGPPPSLTVEGRDIAGEFAELVGLSEPLGYSDYKVALDARYTLPNHRADFLDCTISLEAYTTSPMVSIEGEPHGVSASDGRVVYLTDVDPRETLLNLISEWIQPDIACFSDSVMWRLFEGTRGKVLVVIARERRQIDAVFRINDKYVRLSGGTTALVNISDGQMTVADVGVVCEEIGRST